MLKIVKDTSKSLREKSLEVEMPLSKEDKALLDEMTQHLINSQSEEYRNIHKKVREGVGLAAPQIGVNKRMLVVYYPKTETEYVNYQLVNPKIISESVKLCHLRGGEGCLSVDKDHLGFVNRHYKIVVKAFDALQNKDIEIVARGFDAVVLQHEIDHLNGILFYDHINKDDPFEVLDNSEEL